MIRRTPLHRTALKAVRHALPAESRKRKREASSRAKVRHAVLSRDGFRCRLAGIGGQLAHECNGPSPHHLLKASAGGPYSETNLICVCCKANSMIEDYPLEGFRLGLVQRDGATIETVWRRMYEHGLSSSPTPGSAP